MSMNWFQDTFLTQNPIKIGEICANRNGFSGLIRIMNRYSRDIYDK